MVAAMPQGSVRWALAALPVLFASASPCAKRYSEWLSEPEAFVRKDEPAHLQGLHVACIWRSDAGIELEAYKNCVTGTPVKTVLPAEVASDWKVLRASIKSGLEFVKRTSKWGALHFKQPFAIFDELGKRLASPEQVLEAQLVFVVEGGKWFWPPVREGFVRALPGTQFELETLSVQPVIFRIRGFLELGECEDIINIGEPRMFHSPVSLMDKDKGRAAKDFRTSTQAQVSSSESPLLRELDERIAHLVRIPANHNEHVQILKYEKTQYYSAHLDNWDPEYYQGSLEQIQHGHVNRMLTVFWYLTNVSNGGETLFPRAYGLSQPMDMYSCEKGLKVKPQKGSVIFWYSLHPNGNTNPNGLHAACPVEDGKKWSANYWVWNKPRRGGDMPDEGIDDPDESEKEVQGDKQKQVAPDGAMTIGFENPTTGSAHMFWSGPSGEVYLGEISPQESKTMTTYMGHVWNIRSGSDSSSALISSYVIDGTQNRFSIGKAEL